MDSLKRGLISAGAGALIGAVAVSAKLWPSDSPISALLLPPACWAANEFLFAWQSANQSNAKNAALHYIALIITSYVFFGWLTVPFFIPNVQVAVFALTLLVPAAYYLALESFESANSPQKAKEKIAGVQ